MHGQIGPQAASVSNVSPAVSAAAPARSGTPKTGDDPRPRMRGFTDG